MKAKIVYVKFSNSHRPSKLENEMMEAEAKLNKAISELGEIELIEIRQSVITCNVEMVYTIFYNEIQT